MWIPLMVFAAMLALGVWSLLRPPDERASRADENRAVTPAEPPQSLEGVLVAQLTADEINRRQYRRAMEQLAARDDERHPLTVPPEIGGRA